jgi:very-short-patch-repair endonuclease
MHRNANFDMLTWKCLNCGKFVELKRHGFHTSTKCETLVPWNKGKTKEDTPAIMKMAKKSRGRKCPSVGEKLKARMKDPKIHAMYKAGWSRGQKKRFERPEELEKLRERSNALIASGRILPFGGRKHGNGRPPTDGELEMMRRLQQHGFIMGYVVSTKKMHPLPSHYKLDLANPKMMVAVEVDGSSHFRKARKEADDRKDEFLRLNGWKVLRFRVPFNYDEAALACIALVSQSSSRRTTSRRKTVST